MYMNVNTYSDGCQTQHRNNGKKSPFTKEIANAYQIFEVKAILEKLGSKVSTKAGMSSMVASAYLICVDKYGSSKRGSTRGKN